MISGKRVTGLECGLGLLVGIGSCVTQWPATEPELFRRRQRCLAGHELRRERPAGVAIDRMVRLLRGNVGRMLFRSLRTQCWPVPAATWVGRQDPTSAFPCREASIAPFSAIQYTIGGGLPLNRTWQLSSSIRFRSGIPVSRVCECGRSLLSGAGPPLSPTIACAAALAPSDRSSIIRIGMLR